jgi:hypothetical protein
MQVTMTTSSGSRLIPVTKWPEYHPWPSVQGLRWLVFHRKSNGFARAVRKVGGRVLIDEDEFRAWVEARNAETNK